MASYTFRSHFLDTLWQKTTDNRQDFREKEISCWILTVAQNHTRMWTALRLNKLHSAQLHRCHLLVSINNTLQIKHIDYARSHFLQAAVLQFRFFWDLNMDRMVEICRRFGTRRIHNGAKLIVSSSKIKKKISDYSASAPRGRQHFSAFLSNVALFTNERCCWYST